MDTKNLYMQGYETVLRNLQSQKHECPDETAVRELCTHWFQAGGWILPSQAAENLISSIVYAIVGYGPLEFLLRDVSVSEIMVNGAQQIFVEKSGKLIKSDLHFVDDAQLLQIINRIVGKIGRRIDESNPLVDARLLDGSRVNAIIPPLSLNGPTLTIRKFTQDVFTLQKMCDHDSIDTAMRDFLVQAVKDKKNILISGGTGAGKTSTLNALSSVIPTDERIITIEDAAEINIDHPHCVSLEARTENVEGNGAIPIRALLKNALRMRPDRIVVGEIRGGEAIDMLQAMNTGHQGSITTVHANAPLESLFRIETMVLMGSTELPLSAIRPQINQAIDIICQQRRLTDGSRKITSISQLKSNPQATEYEVTEIFRYNESMKKFQCLK